MMILVPLNAAQISGKNGIFSISRIKSRNTDCIEFQHLIDIILNNETEPFILVTAIYLVKSISLGQGLIQGGS